MTSHGGRMYRANEEWHFPTTIFSCPPPDEDDLDHFGPQGGSLWRPALTSAHTAEESGHG